MAAAESSPPVINGSSPAAKPIELAIPQPFCPGVNLHIHLTILTTTIILFVTTAAEGAQSSALGSFVYALPDKYNPTQPLSTVLYPSPASLDFATRLAKVLVRRTGKVVHVGSSVTFDAAAQGGTVEEEMEGFKRIVGIVMHEVGKAR